MFRTAIRVRTRLFGLINFPNWTLQAPRPCPTHRTILQETLLHPPELCCIQLSYDAFNWATLHPIWATQHPKNYAAPSELSSNLLSYAEPFWATLQPSEISCAPTELRLALNELRDTLKNIMSPAHRSLADPYGNIIFT